MAQGAPLGAEARTGYEMTVGVGKSQVIRTANGVQRSYGR